MDFNLMIAGVNAQHGALVTDSANNEVLGIVTDKNEYGLTSINLTGKVRAMMKYRGATTLIVRDATKEEWEQLFMLNDRYFKDLPVDILIFHSFFVSDNYGFDSFLKLSEKVIGVYSSFPETLTEYVNGVEQLFEENTEVK